MANNPYLVELPDEDEDLDYELPIETVAFGLRKMVDTIMKAPFHNSLILMQLQYGRPGSSTKKNDNHEDDEDLLSDVDEELDVEVIKERIKMTDVQTLIQKTDAEGYLDSGDSELKVDAIESKSVFNTFSMIVNHPSEGWLSLFKGAGAGMLHALSNIPVQTWLTYFITSIPGILNQMQTSLWTGLGIGYVQSLAVTWVLSPLELIRTRLVAQTGHKKLKKYTNSFDAISTIIQEEGLEAMYLGVNGLMTVVSHTANFVLGYGQMLLMPILFGDEVDIITYILYEWTFGIIGLIVQCPLETLKRRLHCTFHLKRPATKDFKSVVRLHDRQPKTILECLEMTYYNGNKNPSLKHLYRGFTSRAVSITVSHFLSLLASFDIEYE